MTKMFWDEVKNELINYLLQAMEIYFDLNPKEQEKFAYKIGEENKQTCPKTGLPNLIAEICY